MGYSNYSKERDAAAEPAEKLWFSMLRQNGFYVTSAQDLSKDSAALIYRPISVIQEEGGTTDKALCAPDFAADKYKRRIYYEVKAKNTFGDSLGLDKDYVPQLVELEKATGCPVCIAVYRKEYFEVAEQNPLAFVVGQLTKHLPRAVLRTNSYTGKPFWAIPTDGFGSPAAHFAHLAKPRQRRRPGFVLPPKPGLVASALAG